MPLLALALVACNLLARLLLRVRQFAVGKELVILAPDDGAIGLQPPLFGVVRV